MSVVPNPSRLLAAIGAILVAMPAWLGHKPMRSEGLTPVKQTHLPAAIFHPTRDLIFDLALFTHPHSQDYP